VSLKRQRKSQHASSIEKEEEENGMLPEKVNLRLSNLHSFFCCCFCFSGERMKVYSNDKKDVSKRKSLNDLDPE
jgi:hypothetical protein